MVEWTPTLDDTLEREDYVLLPNAVDSTVTEIARRRADDVVAAPDEPVTDGLFIWHFPFGEPGLDNLLDSSGIVELSKSLLGTREVLLNNFMLWVRASSSAAALETRFHRDYADNALVASRLARDAIGVIIYLTDVGPEDGPTRYLPRPRSVGLPPYPRWLDADGSPAEDTMERNAVDLASSAGTVLVHSLLGVHRASRPLRPGRRVSMHLVIRRADAHWMSWTPWPRRADSDRFRRAFGHLSPTMRSLIGWPASTWAGWRDPSVQRIVAQRFGEGSTSIEGCEQRD